jgi:hypothetical protein
MLTPSQPVSISGISMLSGLACQQGFVLSCLAAMGKDRAFSKYLAQLGRKGGKARASQMTPAERKELARRAARARWAKKKGGS